MRNWQLQLLSPQSAPPTAPLEHKGSLEKRNGICGFCKRVENGRKTDGKRADTGRYGRKTGENVEGSGKNGEESGESGEGSGKNG